MKTFCLSLLFTVAFAAVSFPARAITLAPTPTPAASPLPATAPEAAGGGKCPVCNMDGCAPGDDGKAATKSDPAKLAETEKAVTQLEVKWCEAEAQHDIAFLEKVEADGFTFTDSTGKLTTKKDEIEEAKQGGDKIEFKLSDIKAHVYGDAVILTGQTTFNLPNTSAAPNAYRWTDVFVRQPNGEWQVVASQATTLEQGEAAAGQNE